MHMANLCPISCPFLPQPPPSRAELGSAMPNRRWNELHIHIVCRLAVPATPATLCRIRRATQEVLLEERPPGHSAPSSAMQAGAIPPLRPASARALNRGAAAAGAAVQAGLPEHVQQLLQLPGAGGPRGRAAGLGLPQPNGDPARLAWVKGLVRQAGGTQGVLAGALAGDPAAGIDGSK